MPSFKSKISAGNAPQHPGEIIHKAIQDSNMHVLQFSKATGMSKFYINNLIDGKERINRASAGKFGRYFGNGSGAWLTMQKLHDDWVANGGEIAPEPEIDPEPETPEEPPRLSRSRGMKSH
jgi:plasmid maintenance system antidote protein VapI